MQSNITTSIIRQIINAEHLSAHHYFFFIENHSRGQFIKLVTDCCVRSARGGGNRNRHIDKKKRPRDCGAVSYLFLQNLLYAVADFQQIKTRGILLHVESHLCVAVVHYFKQLAIGVV